MKKIVIIASLALAGISGVFAQGYVNFATGNNYLWNQFTTPGTGVRAISTVDVAFFWAAVGATDPLTTQGAGLAAGSVATNGVTSITMPNIYNTLTNAGFTLATIFNSGGTAIWQTNAASANINYGQVQVQGLSSGVSYSLIAVGWNASSSGISALTGATYTAIGWGNMISYLTGSSLSDPNGQTTFNGDGLVKFGVAPLAAGGPVPEPSTMALAALGGASLLLFRRRK